MRFTRPCQTALAASAVAVLVLGGCSASGQDQIKLSVATFGEFGYESLYAEYEAQHPGIKIEPRVTDFDAHHKGLVTQLAASRGAADVVAIEEQYMPRFRQTPDKFTDLATLGANDLRGQWAPWKWDQGLAGKRVLGLGTDMGSLAMCYRKDLFAAAGLPTDREEVAKLWPTWEAFAGVSARFSEKSPKVAFADSAGTIYTAMLNQSDENYFARADDSFIADRNPAVKHAFELAGGIGAQGRTAKVTTFTQPWNVAIKQGSFATMTCPAWMLTQIQEAGGTGLAGKWDVTSVPGGGGNWGGSYLTVPAQSAHQREAYDLARWLTAPEQEKKLFERKNILPSEPAVYADPSVLAHTDGYFSGAPVGKLFATAADHVRPNYRGLADADARPPFGQALGRVEEGKQSIGEAWEQAVTEARAAVSAH
ncbi:extracellular solute-binding protein [Amycolatopsis minnesotensis]|uniref:Extracellular solute-binding protein n=1 Tax=Amycolatopsis minnesotensis TaxID=337894 RepID=A0ABN2SKE1_9PSEU